MVLRPRQDTLSRKKKVTRMNGDFYQELNKLSLKNGDRPKLLMQEIKKILHANKEDGMFMDKEMERKMNPRSIS